MSSKRPYPKLRHVLLVWPVAVATVLTSLNPARAAGPFAGFAGTWQGSGDVGMADGSREAIRCKATYKVGGSENSLNISVNCASDDFKVDVISAVEAEGSQFSGTWEETSRQVQGNVTGRITAPGQMEANLEGAAFSIGFSATTRGQQQAVTILPQGGDVQKVSITLHKSS